MAFFALSDTYDLAVNLFLFLIALNFIPKKILYSFLRFTIFDFFSEISNFNLSLRNILTSLNIFSTEPLSLQKSLKSSAYLTILTSVKFVSLRALSLFPRVEYSLLVFNPNHCLCIHQSSSFKTMLAKSGESIPPWGVPLSDWIISLFGSTVSTFNMHFIIDNVFLSIDLNR